MLKDFIKSIIMLLIFAVSLFSCVQLNNIAFNNMSQPSDSSMVIGLILLAISITTFVLVIYWSAKLLFTSKKK